MENNFLKIYLPVYLLLYLLAAFVVPTYRTWKQTGINPITFRKKDTAHDYIGFVMKLIIVLLYANVLTFTISDTYYQYLAPASFMQSTGLLVFGMILAHASLVWIIIAQYQMSNSWRIGIDETNKTELVTKGIFSISRNPVFFGMILTVCGLFLILPNALSFALVLLTYFIIQVQIRLEEDFLEKQHGDSYRDYKAKTRRLI